MARMAVVVGEDEPRAETEGAEGEPVEGGRDWCGRRRFMPMSAACFWEVLGVGEEVSTRAKVEACGERGRRGLRWYR